MHVALLHRCTLHRSYEVAGFLKKNKDPFYDDIKDCLKASALPFVAMLITTDFDKAYLGSPRSCCIRFVQPPVVVCHPRCRRTMPRGILWSIRISLSTHGLVSVRHGHRCATCCSLHACSAAQRSMAARGFSASLAVATRKPAQADEPPPPSRERRRSSLVRSMSEAAASKPSAAEPTTRARAGTVAAPAADSARTRSATVAAAAPPETRARASTVAGGRGAPAASVLTVAVRRSFSRGRTLVAAARTRGSCG